MRKVLSTSIFCNIFYISFLYLIYVLSYWFMSVAGLHLYCSAFFSINSVWRMSINLTNTEFETFWNIFASSCIKGRTSQTRLTTKPSSYNFFSWLVRFMLVGIYFSFLTSGISDGSQSPTSGEYNVCISITHPCTSDAKEDSLRVIQDPNLFKVLNFNYKS